MTDIPQTAKEFDRWVVEKSTAEGWPIELLNQAERVSLALGTLDQKAAEQGSILKTEAAKDVKAFADAYAAFKAANH